MLNLCNIKRLAIDIEDKFWDDWENKRRRRRQKLVPRPTADCIRELKIDLLVGLQPQRLLKCDRPGWLQDSCGPWQDLPLANWDWYNPYSCHCCTWHSNWTILNIQFSAYNTHCKYFVHPGTILQLVLWLHLDTESRPGIKEF